MSILLIVGARPQFIKASVVSKALAAANIGYEIIHTGQHFDENMSEAFFRELDIREPDLNLQIGGGSHGQNTGRMIEGLETVFQKQKPNLVVVFGDTDSTLAGALAAAKLNITVAHVEAGLRSFNRLMPEEVNRVVTDHVSEILFAPSQIAIQNLHRENLQDRDLQFSGDVMFDAALAFQGLADKKSSILSTLGLRLKEFVLATIHREENTSSGEKLEAIFDGFAQSKKNIIMPIHPRTKGVISKLRMELPSNVTVIEPVGYLDMVMLEKSAETIVTDSGGVQKEAFFHQVPCITLRRETEWIELIELGWNRLVPPINGDAVAAALKVEVALPKCGSTPYGAGAASWEIANHLKTRL